MKSADEEPSIDLADLEELAELHGYRLAPRLVVDEVRAAQARAEIPRRSHDARAALIAAGETPDATYVIDLIVGAIEWMTWALGDELKCAEPVAEAVCVALLEGGIVLADVAANGGAVR